MLIGLATKNQFYGARKTQWYHYSIQDGVYLTGWIASLHYSDVMVGAIASHITCLTIVYSTVYSGEDQRKHKSSASLAFVPGIHRSPVNSWHKWPVRRKMLPFDDVIMMRTNHVHAWWRIISAHCPCVFIRLWLILSESLCDSILDKIMLILSITIYEILDCFFSAYQFLLRLLWG